MRDTEKSEHNWIPQENSPNALKGWGRIETTFKTKLNKKKTRKSKVFFKFYKKK